MIEDNCAGIGVDAKTLSGIAGVAIGTLNVWISRGLIPGVGTGTQGRPRLFDLDAAIHVAIMTALVRQGYAAPFAAQVADGLRTDGWGRRGKSILQSHSPEGRSASHSVFISFGRSSLAELDRVLGAREMRPEVFTVVEIERIMDRVNKAFDDPDSVPKIPTRFLKSNFALIITRRSA